MRRIIVCNKNPTWRLIYFLPIMVSDINSIDGRRSMIRKNPKRNVWKIKRNWLGGKTLNAIKCRRGRSSFHIGFVNKTFWGLKWKTATTAHHISGRNHHEEMSQQMHIKWCKKTIQVVLNQREKILENKETAKNTQKNSIRTSTTEMEEKEKQWRRRTLDTGNKYQFLCVCLVIYLRNNC